MGGRIDILNARENGAEPVADLLIRASSLQGVRVGRDLVSLGIDELPVLFVAAACARGETWVTGAEELRVKESDRIAAMSAGLTALCVAHSPLPDGMRIEGRREGEAFAAGRSIVSATTASPCHSPLPACARPAPITVRNVANVATSFRGSCHWPQSVGLQISQGAI